MAKKWQSGLGAAFKSGKGMAKRLFIRWKLCGVKPAQTHVDNGFRSGAPAATRTRDNLLRRQVLYPTELRAQPLMLGQPIRPWQQRLPNYELRLEAGCVNVAPACKP